jgi:hypothetical protein
MEQIYLIGGKAEHGKTTVANYLKSQMELQGKKVCIMHFAEYIKLYLKNYFGWNGIDKTPEIRKFLQELGTDIIREELKKPLFHCGRIAEDIQVLSRYLDVVLIDDVRFLDEAYYLMAMFPNQVTTIRVHRLDYTSSLTAEQLKHRSETEMDSFKFDYNVYTQTGLQHVYDELDRLFKDKLY